MVEAEHRAVRGSDDQDLAECHVQTVREIPGRVVRASSFLAVSGPGYRTQARANCLAAWRRATGNPDDQPEIWLKQGAPAGITMSSAD